MNFLDKLILSLLLFFFVITAYFSYGTYVMKQEVIFIERNFTPEVIVTQVQVPCKMSDYNFTCYFEKPANYWVNVLPSSQCKGVNINSMTKLENIESTGSMRPTIFGGDVLLAVKYNPSRDLVLGDIVITNSNVAHRIVAINYDKKHYYLKGDNNDRIDFFAIDFDKTKYVVCGVLRGTVK
jgi:hypothetical protein